MKIIKNNYIRNFFIMLLEYKGKHIIAMIFSLIHSGLVLLQPIILMNIIDKGIMNLDLSVIIHYSLIYMLVVLLQNIINIITTYLYSLIGKRFINNLRYKLIKHIEMQSGCFHTNIETGELYTVFNNDIDNIEEVASSLIFDIFSDILISIFMCAFLVYLQPDLFLIIILLQPIMYVTQKKYNRISNNLAVNIRNVLGDISKNVQEFISLVPQFIKLNALEYFWRKYRKDAEEYTKKSIKLDFVYSKSMSIASVISNMTMCIIFGYGGYKIVLGTMSIGGLISFNQYSQKLFMPLLKIVQYNIRLKKTIVSINKVYGLLDRNNKIIREKPYYDSGIMKGSISFKNVKFSYDNKKNVYNELNLDIIPFTFNGIVGESGEGKSTVINLLMRLWDTEKGEILIDGINIRRYDINALRKKIALVTQEPFLVNDSILNNLVIQNPEISMTAIIDAVKRAGIYNFIMALPEKFNTQVGENGVKLSGGQKQRIAIARVLLQNAPIVILDEATSALDNNTENYITEEFYKALKGKTVIVISHRFCLIKKCSQINVMKNGRIIEYGTHDYLISKGGEYTQLYNKNL